METARFRRDDRKRTLAELNVHCGGSANAAFYGRLAAWPRLHSVIVTRDLRPAPPGLRPGGTWRWCRHAPSDGTHRHRRAERADFRRRRRRALLPRPVSLRQFFLQEPDAQRFLGNRHIELGQRLRDQSDRCTRAAFGEQHVAIRFQCGESPGPRLSPCGDQLRQPPGILGGCRGDVGGTRRGTGGTRSGTSGRLAVDGPRISGHCRGAGGCRHG